MGTSPKPAIREKHLAFPVETMCAVGFYSMVLGSLRTALQDTPHFQDTANKSSYRKLLLTDK